MVAVGEPVRIAMEVRLMMFDCVPFRSSGTMSLVIIMVEKVFSAKMCSIISHSSSHTSCLFTRPPALFTSTSR